MSQVVFRLWEGNYQNSLSGNQILVEEGGSINYAIDMRGYLNVISENIVSNSQTSPRCRIRFNGTSIVSGNLIENCLITMADTSGGYPSQFIGNYLLNSRLGTLPPGTMNANNLAVKGTRPQLASITQEKRAGNTED